MAYRTLFLLSVLTLSLLCGRELAVPFSVHEGDEIERVITPEHEYIRPVEANEFYRGDLPRMNFHEFKKLKGHHGTLYLVDLSHAGKYFDALPYDQLELHGNLKHFRLALADKKLAMKEDNRIVGRDRRRIKLFPGMKGLNLQRLKYVVIFSEEPLKELALTFTKRARIRHKSLRSVWAWHPEKVHSSILEQSNIQRIYLQVGKGFLSTTARLTKNGKFEIYALDGSPEDIDHFNRLVRKLNTLPFKRIKGIQLDVEPYLTDDYRGNSAAVLERYIRFLHRMKKWSHRRKLQFSVVVPFWFATLMVNGEPLFPRILREVDEVVLMSYRADPKEVLRISADALRWGEWMHRRVAIGIELKPLADERHILYRVGPTGSCITERFFHLKCREVRELRRYTVYGSRLSFFYHPGAIKKMLYSNIPYRSFDGFVFHDYTMLQRFESMIK